MGALREDDRGDKLRNFSPRTEHSYVSAMVGLAKYYRQSPDLNQSGTDPGLSVASQRTGFIAKLAQRGDLGDDSFTISVWGGTSSYSFRRENGAGNCPSVSQKEVERLLLAATTQRDRCLLMTAYATGLRVSELVRLKVSAIDSHRMMVRVEQGKGRKDRYTILSQRLLSELRSIEGASLADLFVSQSKGHSDLDRLRPENLQSGEASG